ncbi:hypothetical protein C6501_07745 [Candidatus Poribacteria bacterium]|nr:MAG: hypothetical protein C6501_07745 [Candidatus Poribacteria bacterium]
MKCFTKIWLFCQRWIKQSILSVVLICLLSSSLLLCVFVRTANLPHLEETYLLGTDSYRFLRQTDLIVSQGHLPKIDTQRWQLEGRDLSTSLNLFSYVLAYSYNFLHRFFPNISLYTVAVYASVVCYALCLLVLFVLWRHVFDTSIALLAVNFTAIFPSLNLHRSAAGFADRDAFVLLLWLVMFLFYLKAESAIPKTNLSSDIASKATSGKLIRYLYAAVSGIAAGLIALAWEGVGLATGMLAIWIGVRVLRGRFSRQSALVYVIWYLCFTVLAFTFTRAYHNLWIPYAFLAIVIPTIVLFCSLTFFGKENLTTTKTKTPISLWKRMLEFSRHSNIHRCLFGCVITTFLLAGFALLQSPDIGETFRRLFDNFVSPLGQSRLMLTVFELFDLSGIRFLSRYSVIALAAMAGCGVLVYNFFSKERAIFRLALIGFEIALCGTLLSLFLTNSDVSFSIFGLSFLIGGITIGVAYILRTGDNLGNSKSLFVLIWVLVGLSSSRGAERYLFFIDPVFAVLVSLLFWTVLRRCMRERIENDSSEQTDANGSAIRSGTVSETLPTELCMISLIIASELYIGYRLSNVGSFVGWIFLGMAVPCTLFGVLLLYKLARLKISHLQRFGCLATVCILILFTSSDVFSVGSVFNPAPFPLHKGFVRASTEAVRETAIPRSPKLQKQLADIAEHTDENAVIAAWWDYGSKVHWFAKRATVVDEDHYIPYWIFLIARHVFSGVSSTEALTFLKTHNVTHLLITTNELLKLDTVTYTGSDETYDRGASVHFLMPVRSHEVTHSVQQTDFIPHSYRAMDTLSLNGKNYPPGKWILRGVSIKSDGNTWSATVHGITKDGEFSLPPSELRVGRSHISHEETGVPGSVVVFRDEANGKSQAFYLSAGAARLLTVRLYLFLEEIPGFSLIYDTNSKVRCEPEGFRLWKIDYPESVQPNPKYREHDFPSNEKRLKDSWDRGQSILQ